MYETIALFSLSSGRERWSPALSTLLFYIALGPATLSVISSSDLIKVSPDYGEISLTMSLLTRFLEAVRVENCLNWAIGLSPIGVVAGFWLRTPLPAICPSDYDFNSIILHYFFIINIFKKFSFWSLHYGVEPFLAPSWSRMLPLHQSN